MIALLLACSTSFPVNASQLGSELASSGSYAGASADATNAGNSSIESGNQNVKEGEQKKQQEQVAKGAMQIAMGMLGLLAALAAMAMSQQSEENADGLSNISPGTQPGATSPSPSSPDSRIGNDVGAGRDPIGTVSTGSQDTKPPGLSFTPEQLREGKLGEAMKTIERQFGIPRDQFAQQLAGGVDPKSIFANAPKNAIPESALARAQAGLAGTLSTTLAGKTGLDPAAGRRTESTDGSTVDMAAGAKGGSPRGPAADSTASGDTDEFLAFRPSEEVRAALAKREEAEKIARAGRGSLDPTIFELVSQRYRKVEWGLLGYVSQPKHTSVP